jgi:hypothetical protein
MAEGQDDRATTKSDITPDVDNARHDFDQNSDVPATVARALYRRDHHRDSYDDSYRRDENESPERYEQYKQYDTDPRSNYEFSPPHEVDQDYYRSEERRDYYHDDSFDRSKQAVWDQVGRSRQCDSVFSLFPT